MKTQIIKIIPCLLAGFILSACVGAINIPSSVAEKTTESEPVIKKTAVVIIDDKEPEPIVIDDKESEPEPIAIEPAHPCIATPFRDICGGAEFNDAREAVCANELTSHRCLAIIAVVCTGNIFNSLCVSYQPSFLAQETACENEPDSERCAPILARVCTANPFDEWCDDNPTYYPAQKTACLSERDSEKCDITIWRVCTENVFDDLCYGLQQRCRPMTRGSGSCSSTGFNNKRAYLCTSEKNSERCAPTITRVCSISPLATLCADNPTYYTAQYMECKTWSPDYSRCAKTAARVCAANMFDVWCAHNRNYYTALETACSSEPKSERCAPTVSRVCNRNSLHAFCVGNPDYFNAQKRACHNGLETEPRCGPTVKRVCDADIFDNICSYAEAYYPAIKEVCTDELNSQRCTRAVNYICTKTPFDMFCQSINLTRTYFPYSSFTGGNAPTGFCEARGCTAQIPSIINIKPLNDTNTGTATYAGSVSLQYYANRRNAPLVKNIDIIADFNNKTLTYSGNLGVNNQFDFSINGIFTDRGLIHGLVSFDSKEIQLDGLIGQDEAIGFFGRGFIDTETNAFAGGFTATRQEPEPETAPNQ